ncbi:MAG: 4Fe-4S dicluster domain-containing protein [Chloroflexi bacterium]|nr:4Fe-4S dicluster domain-containing protein [Chloroflexota bacterium]
MTAQRITRQGLLDWLNGVAAKATLIAPVRVEGIYLFRPIVKIEDIALDYSQSTVPPKEWLFPRSDTLFTIERLDRAYELKPPAAAGPRVLFGIRPCDARALAILDRLFLAEPADNLYEERRQNTVLVGLACARQQLPECFCTSLGGGPQEAANVDVLLAGAGEAYTVTVATEKGQQLLSGATLRDGGEMPPAPSLSNQVPTAGMAERLRLAFNSSYWQRLADRCLGCKMCTYLCPTCHCFDIRDCDVGGHAERVRCWDGCQSALFTKLAGGHNPRASKAARLRQFYAHKYLYFPERFGVTQCVGCGRCAHFCPVNIDIRETLRDLQTLEVCPHGSGETARRREPVGAAFGDSRASA